MPTLEEVGQSLGLSYRQAFRRFDAVRHLIPASVRKGDNGVLILDGGAVAVMRRVEDSRKEGKTLREAVELVTRELDGNGGNGSGKPVESLGNVPGNAPSGEAAVLRELVEELRRDRDHWRTLALDLQDRVLALPSGKDRNPWWWPLRRWIFG